jgi:uncharacterized membrane protein
MDETLRSLEAFLYNTGYGAFMRESRWAWQVWESIHFFGMSLLIGTVGLFDLRLLGFARAVPLRAMHGLIPVGITGFLLNLSTGIGFFMATPDQYMYNKAFWAKSTLFVVAGLNVLFFYARVFRRLEEQGPHAPPPPGARIAGGISLTAWVGVMAAGRLLTFFRP